MVMALIAAQNGESRSVIVDDRSAAVEKKTREKATSDPGSVGAPMAGVVVEIRVKEGQDVKVGDTLVIISAMKVRKRISSAWQVLSRLTDGNACFRACLRQGWQSCR